MSLKEACCQFVFSILLLRNSDVETSIPDKLALEKSQFLISLASITASTKEALTKEFALISEP